LNFEPFKKLVLVVLDGFGIATASHGNAVTLAEPSTINQLIYNYPSTTLQASGPAVGLPWGEMGNSEVGHLNIGSGRIVAQDLSRITLAIEDRSFFKNEKFLSAIDHVKKHHSTLHLLGLVSPGGVHSYDEHLYALLGLAAEHDLKKVFIHFFADGRDTPPKIALETIDKLNKRIESLGTGRIVSITGRFYAMDRAEHWNLTESTYKAIVLGDAVKMKSAREAVEANYKRNISDEMIPPTIITAEDGSVSKILNNDAAIFFNFRPDRALQLTRALTDKGFNKFQNPLGQPQNLFMVTLTEYAKDLNVHVAFSQQKIVNGFAEVISKKGLRQFHVAESEKYAHVSVFFNGGALNMFPGEDREIITSPSSNYQNYQDVPEMSAVKVTDTVIQSLKESYSFVLVNFANPDMVGHTGNLNASIQAVKVVDECIKKIFEACLAQNICLLITADHGNLEELLDISSGGIDKEHSTNPVPAILIASQFKLRNPKDGGVGSLASVVPVGVLSDIAPTMLQLLGIEKPDEMTGISLLPSLLKQIE
jgi:2,3-bisphosphoglycerate-independent phosphoglycerate mutase